MIPARQPFRVIEPVIRRVLGGIQFVDSATSLPVREPATLAVLGATIGAAADVGVNDSVVRIRRNRSGIYVIFSAPFFDRYTSTFDPPADPPETAAGPLRLRVGLIDMGPQYLPREFQIDLPRSPDTLASDNVFTPAQVLVYRTPAAPIQNGWAVLRVLVTKANGASGPRLPGVLVTVFKSPRTANDKPIGAGMTEWRGDTRGEALVPVTGIARFTPGADGFDPDQAIEFEIRRDTAFSGDPTQLPNPTRIAASATGQVTQLSPAAPVRVRTQREHTIHLAMP